MSLESLYPRLYGEMKNKQRFYSLTLADQINRTANSCVIYSICIAISIVVLTSNRAHSEHFFFVKGPWLSCEFSKYKANLVAYPIEQFVVFRRIHWPLGAISQQCPLDFQGPVGALGHWEHWGNMNSILIYLKLMSVSGSSHYIYLLFTFIINNEKTRVTCVFSLLMMNVKSK